MNTPMTSRFSSEHAALVVVDVQNDFCHPEGACGNRGSDTSAAVEMVPRLQKLLHEARRIGMQIVFIQTTHDETTDSEAWLNRRGDLKPGALPPVSTCYTGSWGAEFYDVEPQPGEPVVIKHRYSAFAKTTLDLVLRTAGVDSLLLTGVATNVCVESTLREGLFHEYHVTLVEDCCAAYSQELHDTTVKNVAEYFGVVATSDELIGSWAAEPVPA